MKQRPQLKSNTVPGKTANKSSLLVPCMNCQEFVKLESIDEHSQGCFYVSKNIQAVDKSSHLFDENDFKLNKLKEYIQNREHPKKNRLLRIIDLTKQIQTIGYIEENSLQEYSTELQDMLFRNEQSINIILSIERLHSLILQRIQTIRSQQILVRPTTEQNFYTQKVIESRQSTSPAPIFLSPQGRGTYITKFSSPQHKQEVLSNISNSSQGLEQTTQPDNTMRDFYSICLRERMKLPNNHPAQKLPLSILYKEATKQKVPNQQWLNFILKQYKNPFTYLDPEKLR
ncbi:hypothetical protein pb186bvf_002676 [Paramecium bursaria]